MLLQEQHGLQGLCIVGTVPGTVLCSPAPRWALIQYCDHTKIISLAAPVPVVLFTIFTIFTLHYLHFTILLTRFTIFTQPVTATQQWGINLQSPLPPVRRPPELLQFCTAPFSTAAHVLMRTFLPFPPTIMNIFGRSGAFYSQGRTHNALML